MKNDLFDLDAMRDRFGRPPDTHGWREDILLVGHARDKGWTVDLKSDAALLDAAARLPVFISGDTPRLHCSGESYEFRKGDQHVWLSAYDGLHWNRATISGGRATRRSRHATLKEALDAGDRAATRAPDRLTECARASGA